MNPAVIRSIKLRGMRSSAIMYGDKEVDPDTSIEERVACIFELFDKHGPMNYIGENVTQLQHAQQVCGEFKSIVFLKNYFFVFVNKLNIYSKIIV